MIRQQLLLFLFILPFTIPVFGQDDTLYQRDSVIEMEEDCTQGFFLRSERIKDPAGISIVAKNRRKSTLAAYLKTNNLEGFLEYGLADLDGDGKKELLISHFTGGAHCCDEVYVFRKIAASVYQYVAKTHAGHVCFREDNSMIFSFYEHFGYFFTCYACSYADTTDTAPIPVTQVRLVYKNGKLAVVPGDQHLRSMIRDNLSKLSEQVFEKMDDISQDNGLRKEFALNLAVYYYSFGRNLTETRSLFNTYYKYPDAKEVWAEFYRLLMQIRKTNDF